MAMRPDANGRRRRLVCGKSVARPERGRVDSTHSRAITRRFYEAYDRADRQALARFLSPACVVHLPVDTAPLDRDEFFEVIALFATAFTEIRTSVVQEVAEKDIVVLRWVCHVTHAGAFQGIPATGKRIAIDGVTINRVADGQIVDHWVTFDRLRLLEELGAGVDRRVPKAMRT